MEHFVLQFRLETERYQEDILAKRFEIGRKIYNSLVNITQKRYHEMIKTKEYRSLISSLSNNKKEDKEVWKMINDMRKRFRLYEYAFHEDVKKMQHHFKKNIDAFTAQKIATTVWRSYEKLFYGNGTKVYFKKYNTLNSLEGKSNKCGIRIKNDMLQWNGLEISIDIDASNVYEVQALQCPIVYCRIIRKFVKYHYHYYVQIIFKGHRPVKFNDETGELKHQFGTGDVGLDIGTSTLAIASETKVKIVELADKVQNIEDQKRRLLRKMDRSRRATNPEYFNEDGTFKKQNNQKLKWNQSNHYLHYQNQLKELYRKQADVRKYQHECLANEILSLGDKIYIEKMNFKGLQKRSTQTELNDKGKFKRKKRFGKSIANRAPAMLMTILNRKLKDAGSQLIEINTSKARASQFSHFDQSYKKKKLSQRWNNLNGIRVQRDLYSAFLIMNIHSDLETFDLNKCETRFDEFKRMHDEEVQRLTGCKNLSSIAI